jgi:hypothetical protein
MLCEPKKNINTYSPSDHLSYSTKTISKINQKINHLLTICKFENIRRADFAPEQPSKLPVFRKKSPILLEIFCRCGNAFSMLEVPAARAYKK